MLSTETLEVIPDSEIKVAGFPYSIKKWNKKNELLSYSEDEKKTTVVSISRN